MVRRRGGAQRTRRRVVAAATALALGTGGVVAVAASDLNPSVVDDVVVTEPDRVEEAQIACGSGSTPFDPAFSANVQPLTRRPTWASRWGPPHGHMSHDA